MKKLDKSSKYAKEIAQFQSAMIDEDEGCQYFHVFCALSLGYFRDLVNMRELKLK